MLHNSHINLSDNLSVKSTTSFKYGNAFGSLTDIGLCRDHNEDNLLVQGKYFAVADGMGGHAAGEIASEICIATLEEFLSQRADSQTLEKAVVAANSRIIESALQDNSLMGMGTTLTAAIVEKNKIVLAQVGDSRAYLLHNGKLQRLTRDHSFVEELVLSGRLTEEEARYHKDRSKITRALGSDPNTLPDMYNITIEPGDRLLLCSDGLHGMITDHEIERQLRYADPQDTCQALVNKALDAGGSDNVTCIVVDISGKMKRKKRRKLNCTSKFAVITIAVLLISVIIAAVFGFYTWIHNSAYLAELNGKVAVYKGMPSSHGLFSYSELDQVTDINISDITSSNLVERIKSEQIICTSLDDAWNLVNEYKDEIDTNNKKKNIKNKKINKSSNELNNTISNSNNNIATNGSTNKQ